MKNYQLFIFVGISFFFTHFAQALNESGCSSYLNDGLYKKYEYQGVDQPATKATKKHGSSKGTAVASTEGSTASLDPKVTTHRSLSASQMMSTWGPCNGFAMERSVETREKYFAQNRDEILREISRGQGEHLQVLALYSLCDEAAYSLFAQKLQLNIQKFMDARDNYRSVFDETVLSDQTLASACYHQGS